MNLEKPLLLSCAVFLFSFFIEKQIGRLHHVMVTYYLCVDVKRDEDNTSGSKETVLHITPQKTLNMTLSHGLNKQNIYLFICIIGACRQISSHLD